MKTNNRQRVSYIDSGLRSLPISLIVEILKKRATHVSFHANKLKSLGIHIPQRYSKNKDEDAIRKGAHLEQLLEVDFSSNCLNDGYALPNNSLLEVSFLGLSVNLIKLNLSSNGLTEKSFENLMDTYSLTQLQYLDVSHNHLSRLPLQLHLFFPSLKNLDAKSNDIKSLTSLLGVLKCFRGKKVESVQFSNNPVASKDLYREKLIFVLSSPLTRLDGRIINASEKEKAFQTLQKSIQPRHSVHATVAIDDTAPSKENEQINQNGHEDEMWGYEEDRENDNGHRQCLDPSTDEKIKTLEQQIAFLSSAIVEKKVDGTSSSDMHRHDHRDADPYSNDAATSVAQTTNDTRPQKAARAAPRSGRRHSSRVKSLESEKAVLCRRQKVAAISLLKVLLDRQRNGKAALQLAFSLWMLSTQFIRREQKLKATHIDSEKSWQVKAKELASKAASEAEEGKRKLALSEKEHEASKEQSLHLTKKVQGLEEENRALEATISKLSRDMGDITERLNDEKKTSRTTKEQSRTEMQRLEATLRMEIEMINTRACHAEAELDRARNELQHTNESLEAERTERAKVENSSQEQKESATAQLHEMKIEAIQKEATIQRLKDAYEQAARRSAVDRSQQEKSSTAEQLAKDLLRKKTDKLHLLEAEMHRLHDEIEMNASKISGLVHEVKERDQTINLAERKAKSSAEERDDVQKQLRRAEERNAHLQAQLDQAEENMRKSKRCSVDKEQLDEEISRVVDLKRSLDKLRQSSQARIQAAQSENTFLREEVSRHEKAAKTFSRRARNEWRAREKDIESSHNNEMQKLRNKKEQELTIITNDLEIEKARRLDMEKKVAALEAENKKQKIRMQNAIEGLAKQLAVPDRSIII